MMNQSFGEILSMILGMGQINKKIKLLQERGYEVKNFVSLIENKNDTNTIVYTSKEFQPIAETLSDQYAFIGPSISKEVVQANERIRKQIYI